MMPDYDPHDHPRLDPVEPPALEAQLRDAMETPGTEVEVDPDEADNLGAFAETALSEAEAWEATMDLNWEVDCD